MQLCMEELLVNTHKHTHDLSYNLEHIYTPCAIHYIQRDAHRMQICAVALYALIITLVIILYYICAASRPMTSCAECRLAKHTTTLSLSVSNPNLDPSSMIPGRDWLLYFSLPEDRDVDMGAYIGLFNDVI